MPVHECARLVWLASHCGFLLILPASTSSQLPEVQRPPRLRSESRATYATSRGLEFSQGIKAWLRIELDSFPKPREGNAEQDGRA